MKRFLLTVALLAMLFVGCDKAPDNTPGAGVEIQPARATWNTGYFQEALMRKGLETLGYKLKDTMELQNALFYKTVALGDVDYWTNGWFPTHTSFMGENPEEYYKKVGRYGQVMKAGGLQGFLASKAAVDKYNIKSLDDFKRPEVQKAFDTNGDGKADMVVCPPGWGCEKTINHHIEVYGLKDHVNQIKASYSASMAEVLAKFKKGQPVLFYTWAPNWTIFKLLPGKDVMWINVPETNPTDAQKSGVDRMEVSGVAGAVSDPIKLGFVVSDIEIVANNKFIEKNPAIKAFFSVFSLSLKDVNEQNTKMQDGEKSAKDIKNHVDQWIAKNQTTWNSWLETARKAAK